MFRSSLFLHKEKVWYSYIPIGTLWLLAKLLQSNHLLIVVQSEFLQYIILYVIEDCSFLYLSYFEILPGIHPKIGVVAHAPSSL